MALSVLSVSRRKVVPSTLRRSPVLMGGPCVVVVVQSGAWRQRCSRGHDPGCAAGGDVARRRALGRTARAQTFRSHPAVDGTPRSARTTTCARSRHGDHATENAETRGDVELLEMNPCFVAVWLNDEV